MPTLHLRLTWQAPIGPVAFVYVCEAAKRRNRAPERGRERQRERERYIYSERCRERSEEREIEEKCRVGSIIKRNQQIWRGQVGWRGGRENA